MKLWKIAKCHCTQCLVDSKKNSLDIPLDECVVVGNTALCSFHAREMLEEMNKHIKDKTCQR
jgi:hypothetical protein